MMPSSLPILAASDAANLDYHLIEELSTTKLLYLAQQFLGFETVFLAAVTDEAMHVLEVLHLPSAPETCHLMGPESVPLAQTYCQFVYRSGRPLIVPDARNQAPYRDLATTKDLNIGAYVGVPLITHDGAVFGTLCGIHPTSQTLTRDRLLMLQIAAKALIHQIEQESAIRADEILGRHSGSPERLAELPDAFAFAGKLRAAVLRAALSEQPISLLLFRPPPETHDIAAWIAATAPELRQRATVSLFDGVTVAALLPNATHEQAAEWWKRSGMAGMIPAGVASYPALASNETDLAIRALQAINVSARSQGAFQIWTSAVAQQAA